MKPAVPLSLLLALGSTRADYTSVHNTFRCLHCDTPIATRSASLEADAQAYADSCPTGHASDRNGAGENLYWAGFTGSPPTVDASYTAALAGWYTNEEVNYNYQTGTSNGGVTGHFTQVVWKDSVQIGCGVKLDCSNKFGGGFTNSAVVCRYLAHG